MLYRNATLDITSYIDVDWATCPNDRRSVGVSLCIWDQKSTGFSVCIWEIHWWTFKKRNVVFQSFIEVVFQAFVHTVAKAMCIKKLYAELLTELASPFLIFLTMLTLNI